MVAQGTTQTSVGKLGNSTYIKHLFTSTRQIYFQKIPDFLHMCSTCSELPSYTGTMMYVCTYCIGNYEIFISEYNLKSLIDEFRSD